MNCPVCLVKLEPTGQSGAVRCPKGHGILVVGSVLQEAASSSYTEIAEATPTANAVIAANPNRQIPCPHCGQIMHLTDYAGSGIMIDTCLNCPFRWLDSGELKQIAGRKADFKKLDPELLLALQGFSELEQTKAAESPRVPETEMVDRQLHRPGLEDHSLSSIGAIGQNGSWAIVKLASGPRIGRILLLVVVAAFVLIGLYAALLSR